MTTYGDGTSPVLDFLKMKPAGDPARWQLEVWDGICGGRGNLYGGCGLAAVIEAAEGLSAKPAAWATCQFVGGARSPEVIELVAEELVAGRRMSQLRVTGRVDGEVMLTGLVATGRREAVAEGSWEEMPDVPPPSECTTRKLANEERRGGLRPRIDERTATLADDGFMAAGNGRSALWATMPGGVPARASALAVVGDDVSAGVAAAVVDDVRARSIDNSIRIVNPAETPWVLADIRIHAVADGLGHGTVNLWSQEGQLLAIAGQTGLVGPR